MRWLCLPCPRAEWTGPASAIAPEISSEILSRVRGKLGVPEPILRTAADLERRAERPQVANLLHEVGREQLGIEQLEESGLRVRSRCSMPREQLHAIVRTTLTSLGLNPAS